MTANRIFLRGAMVLAAAALVSKLLGSVYTIVLQNAIGDRGMGLYQMAYPIYATLLIISTAGFPVAVSKFVSEHAAHGDILAARRIYRVSLAMLTVIGVVSAALMYIFAAAFARLAGDPHAAFAIRAVAPALAIVPAMSVMRGYYQGWQMMNATAISQVVEQFVRVSTILVGAVMVLRLGYGDAAAAGVAAFGAVTGGLAGLAAMIVYALHMRGRRLGPAGGLPDVGKPGPVPTRSLATVPTIRSAARTSTWEIAKRLLYYALPVSLGALIVPLTSNVDVLTVTNLLKAGGVTQLFATREFGLLAGRAFKLMMFPAALASSVGIAMLPAVAHANARGDRDATTRQVVAGLRLTILFALPAAFGMLLFARPIDILLFKDAAGYRSIQILAVAVLLSALQIALAAVLQALGAVYVPVRSLLLGIIIKFALNFLLVPRLGIDGAALATVLSFAVATWMNWRALRKRLGLHLPWRQVVIKPAAATAVMAAFCYALAVEWQRTVQLQPQRLDAAAEVTAALAVAVAFYGVMLVLTGALAEEEVAALPAVGRIAARVMRRLGFFASS